MNNVKVLANEMGAVVNVSPNNPEFGYIRVKQTTASFNSDGWLTTEDRYALLKGKLEGLQSLGYDLTTTLPGKLVRQESLEPFDDYSTPKVAGSSGVVCKVNGQPIYSRVTYDPTGTKQDILIPHDNKEEIITAMNNNSTPVNMPPVTTQEAFDEPSEVEEEVIEDKVDQSLNEEVEIEETIDEVEEDVVNELDLETDFEL